MLFKQNTPTARAARFAAQDRSDARLVPTADASAASAPSPEQIEIASLETENAALRRELAQLRCDWDKALNEAETRAQEAAARRHIADDAARTAALRDAALAAGALFETSLLAEVVPLAQKLAADALSRLVNARPAELDWLARLIERRIAELRSDAVVALRLPIEADPTMHESLRAALPAGVAVVPDENLKPGTAMIALRLGQIEIDPALGLAKMVALLEPESAHA